MRNKKLSAYLLNVGLLACIVLIFSASGCEKSDNTSPPSSEDTNTEDDNDNEDTNTEDDNDNEDTNTGETAGTYACPPDSPYTVPKRSYEYAGEGLTKLTEAQLPKNTITIGSHSFQKNRLTTLSLPPCLTSIRGWAFRNNQLTSLTIPAYVTYIAPFAFAYNKLTELTFAAGIPTDIADTSTNGQFANNPLKTVTLSRALYEAFKTADIIPVTKSRYFPNSVTTFQTHDGTKLNNVEDGAETTR